MAFKSLEALQRLFASSPELKTAIEAVARDGFSIMTMPQQVAGQVARTVGKGVEGVADLVGDVAGFAADVGPRLEIGRGDSEIDIPLPIIGRARAAEGVAGLVEKGGEALSKFKMPAESFLDVMDRRIAEGQPYQGPGQTPEEAKAFVERAQNTPDEWFQEDYRRAVEQREADKDKAPSWQRDWEDLSPEEQQAHQDRWGPRNERGERISEETLWDEDKLREEGFTPVGAEGDRKQGRRQGRRQERKARRKGKRDEADAAESTLWDEDKLREEGFTPVGDEDEVDVSGAAKAVPVVPDDQAESLFATVHGGPFDPNSSMDRGKLEDIKKNLVREEFQGLTPNQFALKMYREAA
jgi:hypothetical protein